MKKLLPFMLFVFVFFLTSCVTSYTPHDFTTINSSCENLDNLYSFNYLGDLLENLQKSSGLMTSDNTARGKGLPFVGQIIEFIKHQQEKKEFEAIKKGLHEINENISEIAYELEIVEAELDQIQDEIDQQTFTLIDTILESSALSEIDTLWGKYDYLINTSTYDIGSESGWESEDAMTNYTNELLREFETAQVSLETDITLIHNSIIKNGCLKACAAVLMDNLQKLGSQKHTAVENALLAFRSYYLELVTYQIKCAILITETHPASVKYTIENLIKNIKEQNQNFLKLSEQIALFSGAGLINRTKEFSRSSVLNIADITIHELFHNNTITVRLFWTHDAMKDPDAIENKIDQENSYFTETYTRIYDWLETQTDMFTSINIPDADNSSSELISFDLNYHNKVYSTPSYLWRLVFHLDETGTCHLTLNNANNPEITYDTILDTNKIGPNLVSSVYENYELTLTESEPVLSLSLAAFMPEDRLYSKNISDGDSTIENKYYNLIWRRRTDMEFTQNLSYYDIWPLHDWPYGYQLRCVDLIRDNKWGVSIDDSNFLRDGNQLKIYTKEYWQTIDHKKTKKKTYYVKDRSGWLSLDNDSKDSRKYEIKKKYLSFLGSILDDDYIRYGDYVILHDGNHFIGSHTYTSSNNKHEQRLKHVKQTYCAEDTGILNKDFYFCFEQTK